MKLFDVAKSLKKYANASLSYEQVSALIQIVNFFIEKNTQLHGDDLLYYTRLKDTLMNMMESYSEDEVAESTPNPENVVVPNPETEEDFFSNFNDNLDRIAKKLS